MRQHSKGVAACEAYQRHNIDTRDNTIRLPTAFLDFALLKALDDATRTVDKAASMVVLQQDDLCAHL